MAGGTIGDDQLMLPRELGQGHCGLPDMTSFGRRVVGVFDSGWFRVAQRYHRSHKGPTAVAVRRAVAKPRL